MTTHIHTPPSVLAVSLADAKLNLKIDGSALDTLVEIWLRGVITHAETYMQRALMLQTWKHTRDDFPSAIKLKRPPIVVVDHVKYYDVDDIQRTLAPADYVVDRVRQPGFIVPAVGKAWPATSGRINAVEVQYQCGYGADPADTPADIKLYLLAKLSEVFEPGSAPPTVGKPFTVTFIDSLLDGYEIY